MNLTLETASICVMQFDSPFEKEVYDEFVNHGYSAMTQFPFGGYKIDMAILNPKNPYQFVLGIECDGATYHSSVWKKKQDSIRQDFLERHGWKIERIWSPDWWKDRNEVMNRIERIIKQRIVL